MFILATNYDGLAEFLLLGLVWPVALCSVLVSAVLLIRRRHRLWTLVLAWFAVLASLVPLTAVWSLTAMQRTANLVTPTLVTIVVSPGVIAIALLTIDRHQTRANRQEREVD